MFWSLHSSHMVKERHVMASSLVGYPSLPIVRRSIGVYSLKRLILLDVIDSLLII